MLEKTMKEWGVEPVMAAFIIWSKKNDYLMGRSKIINNSLISTILNGYDRRVDFWHYAESLGITPLEIGIFLADY